MEPEQVPAFSKRATWTSDMSYHSLYEEDDVKKTFISSEIIEDLEGSREKPKVALTKRFSWLHPVVHLFPVAVTFSILQLSFRSVYWADDGRFDKRWQDVLQFPAKLHEILIVTSLSAMVLHIFRRMLVGSNGIPLGLMVGAFQIGSAEYLVSKSYIKPLRHSLEHKHYKTFMVALALGSAIMYSFLVGPASAGALIPGLGWWHIHKPFNDSLPLTNYLGRNQSELYPMKLQRSNIPRTCLRHWYDQGCPAEGFDLLDTWAWTRVKERYRYNVTEGQHYNPVMPSSFSGQAQREIVTGLVNAHNSSTAAAMSGTLHSSILALTDAFWHYINSNIVGKINRTKRPMFTISPNTPVSIPLVQSQCTCYDYEAARNGFIPTDPYITFETGAMVNDFSKSASNPYAWTKWIVPNEAWNFTRSLNITDVKWVDASEVKGTNDEPLHASLAAVVTVPITYQRSLDEQSSLTCPCMIDARWATTGVSFDTADDVVKTDLTDWLDTVNLTGRTDTLSKWNITSPISLSSDWATALQAVNGSGISNPDSIFYRLGFVETLLQEFVTTDDGESLLFSPISGLGNFEDTPDEIAIILSTAVADWISRSTFRYTNFTTVLSRDKDGTVSSVDLLLQRYASAFGTTQTSTFNGQTRVDYKVQRYGWGYGLDTGTIWFSIIILLTHVLLVIVYFVYSFVFWFRAKGWTSNAWGSIGELVALAILSPPADELKNSGAGIHHSKTYMTELRIREEGADPERLELVVGRRNGMVIPSDHMVRIDKEYA
ncbi:hypothetical protein GGR51DRAFT_558006 [Nemania sp. FL0031]|nr:hypothetical protein GGR51DRAFT_558006 [Nemania sp. FL0031]